MRLEKYEGYRKRYPLSERSSLLHERYGLRRGDYVLVSVGELTKRKNHRLMIEAMRELGDLPVSYLICGSGPLEEQLKSCVEENDLSDRVKFAGYVNEIPEVLSHADCFVFPSFQEGLPVSVMEAMAVGLPVIATRIRGITDLLEHTKGGYLAEDWKPENYAAMVRRMFQEEAGKSNVERSARRVQMGEWNWQQIQKFALPVVDAKMREIYQRMAKWEKQ